MQKVSKRTFVAILIIGIIWPLIISSILVTLANRSRNNAMEVKSGSMESMMPRDVVKALWTAEDKGIGKYNNQANINEVASYFTKSVRLSLIDASRVYTERQIDSDRKLGEDRWLVKATFTIPTLHQSDEGSSTVDRTYILSRDGDRWAISEVRMQCTKCKGVGKEVCWLCDGKGRREYLGICDECNGTGRLKCNLCNGKGWLDLCKDGINLTF